MILVGLPVPAGAGPLDEQWVNDRAENAFFHVSVGKASPPGSDPVRHGKAFAVGPGLLVTARHVVGDASDWELEGGAATEIMRATQLVNRKIQLARKTGCDQNQCGNVIVLPAPSYVMDAAGIRLPNAEIKPYFRLSMCDIAKGESYYALMTLADNPANPESVSHTKLIELKADGYKPAEYGSLYMFAPIGNNPGFEPEIEGHDGSPILDNEGNVVALISAVTAASGGGHLILATPTQPMFPGASAILARALDGSDADSLKCSLTDTVRRINRQVSAHVIWSLKQNRLADGKKEIRLHYESVTEQPNIDSIEIDYDFMGRQRSEAQEITRLSSPGAHLGINFPLEPIPVGEKKSREFSLNRIVAEGKEIYEPYLKDRGGNIQYVKLRIIKTNLADGRNSTKETQLIWDWP